MSDKMREEFERWARNNGISISRESFFSDPLCIAAWQAWQASRQALVVELPVDFVCEYGNVFDSAGVRLSLTEAGISYE